MSEVSEVPDSNWTKPQLMGTHNASELAAKIKVDPTLWGRPGYLTEDEANTFQRFKEVVNIRGGDFRATIYSFGNVEGEVYALTRWLRARKYVFDDVMIMVEEASKCSAEARAAKFYPNPTAALGCPEAIYNAQYPQVYSGFAKNGSPVFISKVGGLNIDAVECITTVRNIVKYHWYVQMHDFANRLHTHKKAHPEFNRFECVVILDLENLTMGQLTSRNLSITKEQTAIDALCFPEQLYKMYIVNSPRFFSATWSLIKGWLDPRTANKVEVISSRKSWEQSLLQCIDADQLPSDYGGKGPMTNDTMEKQGLTKGVKRMKTEVIYVRSSATATFDVKPGEKLNVTVFTRSTTGAKFSITDDAGKRGIWVSDIEVKHAINDPTRLPTAVEITKKSIEGPMSVKVKAESMGSRFSASASNYLVVFSVY